MRTLNAKLLKETLDARVSGDVQRGTVGCAALLVQQNGETVYENFFGEQSPGVPVNRKSMFRMASMTKPITGAAISILLERGLLNLDDPVEKFLPEFANRKIGKLNADGEIEIVADAQKPITILHLLTHSSGLGVGEMDVCQRGKMMPEEKRSLSTVVKSYAKNVLSFEPFSKSEYSPFQAFETLGRIAELLSGMEYDAFLQKELFDPLEMVDTTFAPNAEQWARMIPMHNYVDGKACVAETTPGCVFEDFSVNWHCGAAGLASTMDDYRKFAEMLQNGGIWNGRRVLKEETVRKMATPYIHWDNGKESWGLSVRVIRDASYEVLPVGTFGWSGAYGTHFWVDPENRVTAVYLKNSRYDGGSGAKTSYQFEKDVHHSFE